MTRFLFSIIAAVFLNLPPLHALPPSELPSDSTRHPAFAQQIHIEGVKDAGKLNAHLYRGTQPNEDGLRELRKLGVTMIVDLRGEFTHDRAKEKQRVEKLGMKFVLIPGNGWTPPSDKQMAEFFSLISRHPRETIFIHCWLGGDRTGVFLAAYRIAFDHWTPERAVEEMRAFHFKSFWHPAMKDYVLQFRGRLATSKALAPYRDIPASAFSTSTSLN